MSLKPSILTVGNFDFYSVTQHGITFKEETPRDQWLEAVNKLCSMHEGALLTRERTLMLLADALNFGEQAFSHEFAQAIDGTRKALGLSPKTISNAQWAYGKVPVSLRKDGLSLAHYSVIAGLPEDNQEEYISDALKSNLTVKDLKASVATAFPKTKRGQPRKIIKEELTQINFLDALNEAAEWASDNPDEITPDWEAGAAFFYRLYRRKWLKKGKGK